MNIVAIIQARMGSRRLPGKVLAQVLGKPLLWYQLERLKKSSKISTIVVATSTSAQDDILEDFCIENRTSCFRGSEDDVLDRYYRCALEYKADVVVRITADCPLIEPDLIDKIIDYYLRNQDCDLVRTGASYPEGLEAQVFPFKSLKTAFNEAQLKSEREHVTSFLWENDERFKIKTLALEKDYSFLRLTVDEAVDLEVVTSVIEELYNNKGVDFCFEDIFALYREKPEIFRKNKDVIRNEGYMRSIREDCIAEHKGEDEKAD